MRLKPILCSRFKFKTRTAVLIIFQLISCYALLGQTFVQTIEKEVNPCLAEDFQLALDSLQKHYGFPGATAAYVLGDGTTGTAATGLADIELKKLMTVDSRMLSASIGKTFVAANILALSCEGVLDLDVPVSCWLGQRKWFHRLPNHEKITLRHLLTHSSGLPDHVHLESFANAVSAKWHCEGNPFSPENLVEFVLDLPPLFEAGTGWGYSDTGYIVIGLVIEEVTGRSIWDEITDRFLTPLSLKLTTPSDQLILPGLAAGYMVVDNPFGFPAKTTNSNGSMVWNPAFEFSGGGFVSNSNDLARWGWLLYRGFVLSETYLDELLTSIPVSNETDEIEYGAGVAIYHTGSFGPVYGHGGWIPGYCSSLRYYQLHGISIAFQINTDIGLMNDSTPVVREMESCLAEILISASGEKKNMK